MTTMPIEDRNVEPGTVLVARYKRQDRRCEVVQTDEGVRYRLDDGTEHRSPSSAGKAAMGGVACNGWRFWSVQRTERARREPTPKPAKKAAPKGAAKKPAAKKTKGKAVRARAKEVPSYGCGGCGAVFGSQKAAVAHALTHTSS
jgi:hypothetical protein